MTKNLRTFAAIIAVIAMCVVPGHAESTTRTYVTSPADDWSVFAGNVGVGAANIWGGLPGKLLSIKVEDRNGPGVHVTVCQENRVTSDAGDVCGDGGDDVKVSFCSASTAKNVSDRNFKPNSYFYVEVDTTSAACPTIGTTGTITLAS